MHMYYNGGCSYSLPYFHPINYEPAGEGDDSKHQLQYSEEIGRNISRSDRDRPLAEGMTGGSNKMTEVETR